MAKVITAAGPGDWSAGGTWDGGAVPGDGDTADLNGFAVVMDIATIPASGTLAGIISPGKAGTLTVALDALGNAAINAAIMTAGTQHLIQMSGATANTMIITGNITGGTAANIYGLVAHSTGPTTVIGNVTGGPANNAVGIYGQVAGTSTTVVGNVTGGSSTSYGIRNVGSGAIIVVGNVTGSATYHAIGNTGGGPVSVTGTATGGTGTGWQGIYNSGTGTVAVTGNVVGGSGVNASGVSAGGTGAITLNSCNLIDGTGGMAYSGKTPTWNITAANYHQLADGTKLRPVAIALINGGLTQ